MATINLAPGAQYLAQARQRRALVFGVTGGLAVILAGIWTGLFLMERGAATDLQTTEEQLQGVERAIAELGPEVERITLFEQRLTATEALLRQHVNWAPLFAELERLLPAPTVLTNFKGSVESGVIEVSGVTPNIDEVAQMIASLTSAPARPTIFKEADLHSVQRREEQSTTGAPPSVAYAFNGSFTFDASAIQAGLQTAR